MDCEEQILVRCGSNDVCCKDKCPGHNGCVSKTYCTSQLKCDDCQHQVFCEGFWTTELGDLIYMVSSIVVWVSKSRCRPQDGP